MSAIPVRRCKITVQYAGQNIAENVTEHIVSFDYTDVVDGEHTDSLNIIFADADGYWQNEWFPERGKVLKAAIVTRDWPGSKTLNCGTFELDDINYQGPPNTCAISALAVGVTTALRREKKNEGWESITLQQIAEKIASKHSFQLEYEGGQLEKIDRFDQRDQTDLELLALLSKKYGLGLQVTDKKIRIFDAAKRDGESADITFKRNAEGYIRHNLRIQSVDVYKGVQITYFDPVHKNPLAYYYDAEAGKWSNAKPPTGYILKLNERCQSESEAQRIAKAALRDKNKREVTGSITVMGDTDIRAGKTAKLEGFGKFDGGQYFIEKAPHRYDRLGGYETTAEIRGTIGY